MAAAPTDFHLFPRLPAEVRSIIWQYALPGRIGPAFARFRYNNRQIDTIKYKVPLAFVNKEAHSNTQLWARKNGVREDPCRNKTRRLRYTFQRRFEPKRDTLYVALDQVHSLFKAVPSHNRPDAGVHLVGIPSLAFPEAVFRFDYDLFFLGHILSQIKPKEVLIVAHFPVGLQSGKAREIHSKQSWRCQWTGSDFEFTGDHEGSLVKARLSNVLARAQRTGQYGLGRQLRRWLVRDHFEIRFATVDEQNIVFEGHI